VLRFDPRNIYEQYLGYTVRLTDHQVKYELKPELCRAGGVYYTPEHIVDYIVKNSVEKALQKFSDRKLKKLKILDPACGSGSFLIRAYDEMLKYYRSQKKDNQKSKNKMSKLKFGHEEAEPSLTIEEKSEILRKHIFGVDIDEEAVEVTKLSLMLKILEDEYGLIYGHSILPILDRNIRCGNSLISGDVLELKKYFGDEWYAIKPFNWEKEFEKIMVDEGGFDVIIGNPPYVFTRELIKENEKDYYNKIYKNTQFKINTYFLFVEKGYNLLKNTGTLAFIIPNNWLSLETASEFRRFILSKTFSVCVVNNRDKIFKNASVDTSILIFSKKGKKEIIISEFENCILKEIAKDEPRIYLDSRNCLISYEVHKTDRHLNICKKIRSQSIDLEIISEVKNGIQAYTVGEGVPKQTEEMKNKRVYHSYKKENNLWLKYVDGVDVKRYFLGWSKQFVKYGKNLSRSRKPYLFSEERLLVRQIPDKPPYCILTSYVAETLVNDNNSMIIKKKKNNYSLKYIMGILNSKLISFWFIYTFGKLQRKVFPQFKVKELSIFPILPINFNNIREKNSHDKLVDLVDMMLKLNKRIRLAKGGEVEQIQRQIDKTNGEIDELVYSLYGITREEKKIVG